MSLRMRFVLAENISNQLLEKPSGSRSKLIEHCRSLLNGYFRGWTSKIERRLFSKSPSTRQSGENLDGWNGLHLRWQVLPLCGSN